jgi:flagellar basal body-associated protein FliL
MRKKQIILTILLAGTMMLNGGCVVAAVGIGAAGTIAYVRGDLQAVESERIDEVYEATLKAVDELELNVTSKSKDALSAIIIARDADDKKVTIKLKATAEGPTELSIRIGVFGSETKSRLIYQKIRKNLRK